ncbi:MAG: radical SAM protein [Candidatus Omnitrophota bacterium]|nr:radical SAM protein [Candidatus Omnitrophota bacterium]
MTRKTALLFNPPTGKMVREDRCQADVEKMVNGVLRTPIDLLTEAACLEREGVTCRLRDYPALGLTWADVEREMAEFRPEMVVISVTTPTLPKDLQACALAKRLNPHVLTVAKGAHFLADDISPFQLAPELDVIVRGEAEEAIAELATASDCSAVTGISYRKGAEIMHTAKRPLKQDLDSLPFPARHLINNALYIRPDTGKPQTTISASRGCPFECIYCLAPVVSGSKLRMRSPKNVVDEVEECVTKFGIRNFLFLADTFTLHKTWTVGVCQEVVERGLKIQWCANSRANSIDEEKISWMKKSGCWLIAFGLESGSQELLNKMKKSLTLEDSRRAIRLCRRYGIKSSAYFIFGLPWETRETAEATIAFAKELNPNFTEFYTAYPFPGTEFHDIALNGKLFDPRDLVGNSYAGHDTTMISSYALSQQELVEIIRRAAREFYFRPSYVWQTLRGIRSLAVAKNYAQYGLRAAGRLILR